MSSSPEPASTPSARRWATVRISRTSTPTCAAGSAISSASLAARRSVNETGYSPSSISFDFMRKYGASVGPPSSASIICSSETPRPLPSATASAAPCVIASTHAFSASLSRVPLPAGPGRTVRCPIARKIGSHRSIASSGPEASTVSLPSCAGLAVPRTGASRIVVPWRCAISMHRSIGSIPIVPGWPQIASGPMAGSIASATSSVARASASIVSATSAPSTASSGRSTTVAPSDSRSRARSVVRFHARTVRPARAMLRAIGPPITPVPRTATVSGGPLTPAVPAPCGASARAATGARGTRCGRRRRTPRLRPRRGPAPPPATRTRSRPRRPRSRRARCPARRRARPRTATAPRRTSRRGPARPSRSRSARPSVVRRLRCDVGERRVGVALDGEVAERDDAGRPLVLDDEDAADVLLAHEPDRVVDGLIDGQRRRPHRGGLADARRVGVEPLRDDAHGDVTVGDDAGDLTVLDDHDRADVAVAHLARGVGDRRTGLDRARIGGHDLTDALCHPNPSLCGWHLLLRADRARALASRLGLPELAVDVVPVEVAEERLDVLLAPVRGRAEVARVGVLVDVDREHGAHVVDGPQVLAVHDVVEQRAVVQVVADHDPPARRGRGLAHGVLPLVDAVELALDQLGEAPFGLAAVTAEVAEVQVVVLVAEQRERVVHGDGAQVGVDLVALDLRVVELVQALAALVRLLDVALVELVVVLHRLPRDAVEVAVERGELAGLDLVPGHAAPFGR